MVSTSNTLLLTDVVPIVTEPFVYKYFLNVNPSIYVVCCIWGSFIDKRSLGSDPPKWWEGKMEGFAESDSK